MVLREYASNLVQHCKTLHVNDWPACSPDLWTIEKRLISEQCDYKGILVVV